MLQDKPRSLKKKRFIWVQILSLLFLNNSISSLIPGGIVAIDGKNLRHSYDKNHNQKAITMVSAWALEQGLVLGQTKVDSKSNEITAIPKLLKVLYLKGAIVTIDAIGCQKEIMATIVDKEADYLITLKKNQSGLYDRVEDLFRDAFASEKVGYEYSEYMPKDSGHGRKEIRIYQVLNNVQDLVDPDGEWKRLNSVKNKRKVAGWDNDYLLSILENY